MFFPPRILLQYYHLHKGHFSPTVEPLTQTKHLQSTLAWIPTARCISNVLFIYLFIMYSRGLYIVRDGIWNMRLNVPLCIQWSRDKDGFFKSQKITSTYQRRYRLWLLIQEIELQGNKSFEFFFWTMTFCVKESARLGRLIGKWYPFLTWTFSVIWSPERILGITWEIHLCHLALVCSRGPFKPGSHIPEPYRICSYGKSKLFVGRIVLR